ncbi:MAG TPA: hypothetical protein VF931_07630 [Steroidobacteraceae bacterium]
MLAFVVQHLLEPAPTGIEHGFGHPCLDKFGAAHIAYEDRLVTIDHPSTELVERIAAQVRDSAMQALGLTAVAAALSLSDLALEVLIEPPTFQPFPLAGGGDTLEPQINANR